LEGTLRRAVAQSTTLALGLITAALAVDEDVRDFAVVEFVQLRGSYPDPAGPRIAQNEALAGTTSAMSVRLLGNNVVAILVFIRVLLISTLRWVLYLFALGPARRGPADIEWRS
jgi:hypothetical protein